MRRIAVVTFMALMTGLLSSQAAIADWNVFRKAELTRAKRTAPSPVESFHAPTIPTMSYETMCPPTLSQDKTSFGGVSLEFKDDQHYNHFSVPLDGHPGSTSSFGAVVTNKDDFSKLAVDFYARLNDYGGSKDPQDATCPPTAYFIYQVTDPLLSKILPYQYVSATAVPVGTSEVSDCSYSFVVNATKFQSLIDQALQVQPLTPTETVGTVIMSGEVCAPGQNHLWSGRMYFSYGYQPVSKRQNPNLGPSPQQYLNFDGFYQWGGFKDPK